MKPLRIGLAVVSVSVVLVAAWIITTWPREAVEGARPMNGVVAAAKYLSWSPDGRLLAGALQDGSYLLWDAGTGGVVRELRGAYRGAGGAGVAFAPGGAHVVVEPTKRTMAPNGYFSVLGAWSVADGTVTDIFGPSSARAYTAATDRLLVLYERGEVIAYDPRAWQPAQLWKADLLATRSFALQPGGKLIAFSGTMLCPRGLPPARLWVYDTGDIPPLPFVATPVATLDAPHNDAVSIQFTWLGKDKLVSTASQIGTGVNCDGRSSNLNDADRVAIWQAQDGKKVGALPAAVTSVESLAARPDGKVLALAAAAGEGGAVAVQIWDVEAGRLIATWGGDGSAYGGIAFSPDGTLLAASRTRQSPMYVRLAPIAGVFGEGARRRLASYFPPVPEVVIAPAPN